MLTTSSLRPRVLAALAAFAVALPAAALAQSDTGTLVGAVTDENGTPVPDVIIEATAPSVAGEQTVVSDASGAYRIPQLPPGAYKLVFTHEGYKPLELTGIALAAGTKVAVNARLESDGTAPPRPGVTPPPPPSTPEVEPVAVPFKPVKDGALELRELKLCRELAKDGPNKFECAVEADPREGVPAETMVFVWIAYGLAPEIESDKLEVVVKQGPRVRESKEIQLKSGPAERKRGWVGVRLPKPGRWTLSVEHGGKVLHSIPVKATRGM